MCSMGTNPDESGAPSHVGWIEASVQTSSSQQTLSYAHSRKSKAVFELVDGN